MTTLAKLVMVRWVTALQTGVQRISTLVLMAAGPVEIPSVAQIHKKLVVVTNSGRNVSKRV